MKIAVTGSKGRLGSTLCKMHGYSPILADITNADELRDRINEISPEVIINCAAYTDVDGCEKNKEKALAVNFLGVRNLRKVFSGKLIHISTSYVFDGKRGNYSEDAPVFPVNYYAITKTFAEYVLFDSDLIIRTGQLYGGEGFSNDFLSRLLRDIITMSSPPIEVSDKVISNYCHVIHLSKAIDSCINNNLSGVYNVAEHPAKSRYELAKLIAEIEGFDTKIIKKGESHREHDTAKRPLRVDLNLSKAKKAGIPLFTLESGLDLWSDAV